MKVRVLRVVAAVGCVGAVSVIAPKAAQAESSTYTSPTSEVDACNQAQYLMPEGATARSFQVRNTSKQGLNQFTCKVRWTQKAGTQPSGRPILFPNSIPAPLFSL